MTDKVLHTIQLGMILVTALLLIVFAHSYISPDLVFTSMVAGVGGIVGSRIASNGYTSSPSSPSPTTGAGASGAPLTAVPLLKGGPDGATPT